MSGGGGACWTSATADTDVCWANAASAEDAAPCGGAATSLLSVTPYWVYSFPLNKALAGGGGAFCKAITSAATVGWMSGTGWAEAVGGDTGSWIGASVAVASARRVSAGVIRRWLRCWPDVTRHWSDHSKLRLSMVSGSVVAS